MERFTKCIEAAKVYRESESQRYEDLSKFYIKKSDDWLIKNIKRTKGSFKAAYGVMVLEAEKRGINLDELTLDGIPNRIPNQ